jgi:hypothetical protein
LWCNNGVWDLHLHQTLLLGLHTFKQGRIRELEFVVLGCFKSVVRLGFGDLFDEVLEVTAIPADLETVEVKDVGYGVIEETRVMRHNDYDVW